MVKLYVGIYIVTLMSFTVEVSAWLLLNANSAIFQQVPFQCKNDEVRFVLDQHD